MKTEEIKSQIRVLVVDPDAEFRENATLELEQHGLSVLQAESVDEALALLEVSSFELVLTELFFSDRPEGQRLLATIRRNDLAGW